MKKFFFFATALMMSGMLMAQNMELSMADFGSMSWGGATVNGNVATLPAAWDAGIGWDMGGQPLIAYHRVVMNIEPFDGQIGLSIKYSEADGDYVQSIAAPGSTQVTVAIDPAKATAVIAIYIQASKMGNITINSCYLEGGADPYDISSKFEIPLVQEAGENCIFVMRDELEAHDPADVVVCKINCLSAEKLINYGIAKVVAMSDWENAQYEMMNQVDGIGQSEYKFLISELIDFGKRHTSEWYVSTDPDHPGSGVIFNAYQGESEIVGELKCYSNNSTAVEKVAVKEAKAQKVVENGVLYILKNGVKYNALGAAAR